jgi:hypothetical protein
MAQTYNELLCEFFSIPNRDEEFREYLKHHLQVRVSRPLSSDYYEVQLFLDDELISSDTLPA